MGAHLERAFVLFAQSRHDLAEGELRQELAANPNSAVAHALLAWCLCERKEYREATTEAKMAIHLAPDEPRAYHALAHVFLNRNHLPEAEETIQEAIRLDPEDPEYFHLLAVIRLNRRQWGPCLEAAEQGLRLDPEHVGCNNLRAMALVKLGRKREAGATIATALAKNPDNAFSHANQGWTLLEQGDPRKALEHFREALRLEPQMDWARQGIVEALKARNPIYRVMLWYFFWMAKLSGRAQWAVVIGGYLGYRVLRDLAARNPEWQPYVLPVLIIYIAFALMTWIADPLFNLLLRLSRFGRMALSHQQIVASNWIGACVLVALAALGVWLATGQSVALLAAMVFGILIVPLAGTFRCRSGWPRQMMTVFTALMALAGLGTIGLAALDSELCTVTGGLFIVGMVLSPWLANAMMMVRPRR
jgi:tetratricopeptide (TPR) repeat protein